jgi:hypothetical protein
MRLLLLITGFAGLSFAQELSDADIRAALERGQTTPAKKLWQEIKTKQQFRLNRAGLSDPIEKKVLILTDRDRISLEAAEAKRQLRKLSVEDVKRTVPLGVVDVLLEANCYNNLYAGSLPKWGPNGGVHVVLDIGESVIQPIGKRSGGSDSVAVLPQEHGVVSGQGNSVTYTPLYRTAIYERASLRAWFAFPAPSANVKTITIKAISGEGKSKQKEFENPLAN